MFNDRDKNGFFGPGGPRAPRTSFFSLAPAPGAAASLFHAGKCPGWRRQGELDTERLRVSTARAAPVWPLAISRVNLPLNNSRGYIYIYIPRCHPRRIKTRLLLLTTLRLQRSLPLQCKPPAALVPPVAHRRPLQRAPGGAAGDARWGAEGPHGSALGLGPVPGGRAAIPRPNCGGAEPCHGRSPSPCAGEAKGRGGCPPGGLRPTPGSLRPPPGSGFSFFGGSISSAGG